MRDRPIQMSGLNVARTIAGLKCETRRLAGLDALNGTKDEPRNPNHWERDGFLAMAHRDKLGRRACKMRLLPDLVLRDAKSVADLYKDELNVTVSCPYGNIGDLLWFRETSARTLGGWVYRADAATKDHRPMHLAAADDWCEKTCRNKWTPAIHMPKVAARVTAEVLDINLERLWDITTAGAKREGCADLHEFTDLWVSLNGQASWDLNPWVWVVLYRKVKP